MHTKALLEDTVLRGPDGESALPGSANPRPFDLLRREDTHTQGHLSSPSALKKAHGSGALGQKHTAQTATGRQAEPRAGGGPARVWCQRRPCTVRWGPVGPGGARPRRQRASPPLQPGNSTRGRRSCTPGPACVMSTSEQLSQRRPAFPTCRAVLSELGVLSHLSREGDLGVGMETTAGACAAHSTAEPQAPAQTGRLWSLPEQGPHMGLPGNAWIRSRSGS